MLLGEARLLRPAVDVLAPSSVRAPAPMVRRRVAMLGIFHETNTFSEVAADYAAFDGTSAEAPGLKSSWLVTRLPAAENMLLT